VSAMSIGVAEAACALCYGAMCRLQESIVSPRPDVGALKCRTIPLQAWCYGFKLEFA